MRAATDVTRRERRGRPAPHERAGACRRHRRETVSPSLATVLDLVASNAADARIAAALEDVGKDDREPSSG